MNSSRYQPSDRFASEEEFVEFRQERYTDVEFTKEMNLIVSWLQCALNLTRSHSLIA